MGSLVPRRRATVAGRVRSVGSYEPRSEHEAPVLLDPRYWFEAGE